MSLLFTEDKKELIVTCKCGCEDAFHFVLYDMGDDDFSFLTFLKADFNTEYYKGPWRSFLVKCKKIWYVLRGKDYCYADTIMTKGDFLRFKEYINSIPVDGEPE